MATENEVFNEFLDRAESDYADELLEEDKAYIEDFEDVEEENFEELEDIDEENPVDNKTLLAAGKLYDTILRHPDWRVVEVSEQGSDYCHPLKYHYSGGALLFQYDGTSRPLHHEAECEEIINLNGSDSFSDERYNANVYILQDIYSDGWDWDGEIKQVRKATLDAGAKWIKLHPEK